MVGLVGSHLYTEQTITDYKEVAKFHHETYLMAYQISHTPKSHAAIELIADMSSGTMKDYSTIRFEGLFSMLKCKRLYNHLNIPYTLSTYWAIRRAISSFTSPSNSPPTHVNLANFSAIENITNLPFILSCNTSISAFSNQSACFHGVTFRVNDIVSFMSSTIFFRISQIISFFTGDMAVSPETCNVDNVRFLCYKIDYHFDRSTFRFRIIKENTDDERVFKFQESCSLSAIPTHGNYFFPPTFHRIPQVFNVNVLV